MGGTSYASELFFDESWDAIDQHFFADETETVNFLLSKAKLSPELAARIHTTANQIVTAIRSESISTNNVIQSFMHEYDLSSQEGILLMRVAEALLRIPDTVTADRLIHDKFSKGDWEKHVGSSKNWLVNASTWGLILSGKITRLKREGSEIGQMLEGVAARLSDPVMRAAVRQAMKIMAEHFVLGRTIEEAIQRGNENAHYRYSFDMLGESALTFADAERYFASYMAAIETIGSARQPGQSLFDSNGISVKLSALHPRYEVNQRDAVLAELSPKVLALAKAASKANINMTIDAEEAERLSLSLKIFAHVRSDSSISSWNGLGLAVQAYQKRAWYVIQWLAKLAQQTQQKIPIRLVKGAYWDTEIKRAQQAGLSAYPVFTRKAATDVSYLACANAMIDAGDIIYPQFATHNAHTVSYILERMGSRQDFEFQRLHGMGDALYNKVMNQSKVACRVYAPVGSHTDLLPYLVRRLLENGANTSFVNSIADTDLPVEKVIADPVSLLSSYESKPDLRIPLPRMLYGTDRVNSKGLSFADKKNVQALLTCMRKFFKDPSWSAKPIVNGKEHDGVLTKCFDPSNRQHEIGYVLEADESTVQAAITSVKNAQEKWNNTSANDRAHILERAAHLLEDRTAMFMAFCVREAGKTLPDALGEVREAVDMLRYYAAESRKLFGQPTTLPGPTGERNQLGLQGRGVFVCISPWNFPLAIYLGQIGAALAAGNTVIAKPAEQTPLIACAAIHLLLKAGLPPDAIAFLPGDGEKVGAALIAEKDIAGVCFTGSTQTAKLIHRNLAAKDDAIIPLIAETGGINVMIADSSTLPEQLVQDALFSAFNSAGQRCSALRVLFVQEEIADKVIHLIAGALETMKLNDPGELSTDIGPVIDQDALDKLKQHEAKLSSSAKLVGKAWLPDRLQHGLYFAPCAYEIPSFDWLTEEIFGPVLHIVRYRENQLDEIVDSINRKGYGLTMGIHSRIDQTIERIIAKARVGNIYVNRNIIGAVVGTQPFGGEGLSGTGPKAGGPHYLLRFATERTVSINTAAAGGNTSLMSMAIE